MLKKKRFLIAGLILFLALGYLGYTAFAGAATYYYTVGELAGQGDAVYGETVRVNGQVAPGSVQREAAGRTLKFTVIDAGGTDGLPVFYQGVVPDTFQEDADVVVEGHLTADGVFQAHTVMAKCPSKYVAE